MKMNTNFLKAALLSGALASAAAWTPVAQAKTTAKTSSKAARKPAVKIVTVCPVMQHEVPRVEANSLKQGNVKAYFCCGGCKAKFNGYSAQKKQQALRSAMQKQAASKKA